MNKVEEIKDGVKKMNGVMANWLNKSKTESGVNKKNTTTSNLVKKEDKSKSMMNNWLKRSSNDDESTVKKMKIDKN